MPTFVAQKTRRNSTDYGKFLILWFLDLFGKIILNILFGLDDRKLPYTKIFNDDY